MNSFILLVAACAAGQMDGGDMMGGGCGCSAGGHPGIASPVGYFGPKPHCLRGRLRSRFGHGCGCGGYSGDGGVPYALYAPPQYSPPTPPPAQWGQPTPPPPAGVPHVSNYQEQEPPLALATQATRPAAQPTIPVVEENQSTTVVTRRPELPALATPPAAAAPKLPAVAGKYEDKVGHEDDYSWVTGHLFYVHADGGRWVVRYGLPEVVDRYGGSVVLAPGVDMKNYREGDLVCVYGRVIDENRSSPSLGGALYRVDNIGLLVRADP